MDAEFCQNLLLKLGKKKSQLPPLGNHKYRQMLLPILNYFEIPIALTFQIINFKCVSLLLNEMRKQTSYLYQIKIHAERAASCSRVSVIQINLQPHLESNKPSANKAPSTHLNIYLILMAPNRSRDKGRTGTTDDKFNQVKIISLLSFPFHVYCGPAQEVTLFQNLKHILWYCPECK